MGTVYFVKLKGLHPIKIAYTNGNINTTIKNLNKVFPFGCKLIHSFKTKGAKEVCDRVSNMFKSYRINEDWFNIIEEDIDQFIHIDGSDESEREILSIDGDVVLEWMDLNIELGKGKRLHRRNLFDSFLHDTERKDLTAKYFKLKLDEFIKFKGFIPVSGRDHIGRYTLITTI